MINFKYYLLYNSLALEHEQQSQGKIQGDIMGKKKNPAPKDNPADPKPADPAPATPAP